MTGAPGGPLLEVLDLRVAFGDGGRAAVDGISFEVGRGDILGIVGESGSGKSATLKAVLRLLRPPARITGQVLWKGADLLAMPPAGMARVRGSGIAMIFQEPMSALNPILEVGVQITEVLKVHRGLDRRARGVRARELLDRVGIASADKRMRQYPYELSGGMRQRVMIAIALAAEPQLLLADEPTTALDVSIQSQILVLLQELTAELGMALILVTHDLGVVAETCGRVAVMYAGQIVEQGPTREVLDHPKHGYTAALIASVPEDLPPHSLLRTIKGQSNVLTGAGCRFQPRCDYATTVCERMQPAMTEVRPSHWTACFQADQIARP